MKKIFVFFMVFFSVSMFAGTYTFENSVHSITATVNEDGTMSIPELGTYTAYEKDDLGYYFEGDNKGILFLSLDGSVLIYGDGTSDPETFKLASTESLDEYCDPCHGTGICRICRGTAEYDGGECIACGGTGKCSVCHGSGQK